MNSFLFVGLGNPGSKYSQTRHNIGRMYLEYLSHKKNLSLKEKFKGLYTKFEMLGTEVIILLPETFMNLSGESVRPCMDFFKVSLENIIVFHDEIDLPFLKLQLKLGGGFAGHNGLKSMGQHLSGPNFSRLRIGVGKPEDTRQEISSFVLSPFSALENNLIHDKLFSHLDESIEILLKGGFKKAQSHINSLQLGN
jgi:PTH1 family peptidyl-tRNA hydrolase